MTRHDMIERVGSQHMTANIEGGEYSYVQEAGSKAKLKRVLGREPEHFKLDLRFEENDVVVLIETKQSFVKSDEKQLQEYLEEERLLHYGKKIIAILANTNNDKIKVWKSFVDDEHILKDETALDSMEHYQSLFEFNRSNDREKVLKNTYALNETLHKKDIDEKLRSQFVGTTLLYIRDVLKNRGITAITDETRKQLREYWKGLSANLIRSGIGETLTNLLDGSDNKTLKIELLQRNVINDQKVKKLQLDDWIDILDEIVGNIYRYINTDSSEGQDILNLFFIAFNKYTGMDLDTLFHMLSYDEYAESLLEKYGPAKKDYFTDASLQKQNNVSRTGEGLFCHHIDEDKAVLLSDADYILNTSHAPFEYQKVDRLVYLTI